MSVCFVSYADHQNMTLARLFGAQTTSVLRPPFLPYWLGQSVSAVERGETLRLEGILVSGKRARQENAGRRYVLEILEKSPFCVS